MKTERPGLIVGVFAKYPEEGLVKTRLIPSLGVKKATRLARYLFMHAMHQLQQWQASHLNELQVWVWRAGGSQSEWSNLLRKFNPDFVSRLVWCDQPDSHLGSRMEFAMTSQLQQAPKSILVGTDAIQMTPADYQAIAKALDHNVLVYQPALDGGYVAVAATKTVPSVFGSDICWGTSEVLTQSLDRASIAGVLPHCMQPQMDLDESEDFEQAMRTGHLPTDWEKLL